MTETDQRWAVGVDLGGTNVRVAAIDAEGVLLEAVTERVAVEEPEPFGQLRRLVSALLEQGGSGFAGIGIGATGPVDPEAGVIDNPFTLPASYQGNVREVLEDAFGVSVVLENDADSAAVGERWQGAGRGAQTLVCMTVGTGVGVGVVHDGAIHRGAEGTHPEAGHHVVDPAGPSCYCGRRGCVESLASGGALVDRARAGGEVSVQSAADVFERALSGHRVCVEVVEQSRRAIQVAAVNLVALHAADVIVLSGGALGDRATLLQRVQAAIDAFAFRPRSGATARLAELPDLAGCYGAAYLTLQPDRATLTP